MTEQTTIDGMTSTLMELTPAARGRVIADLLRNLGEYTGRDDVILICEQARAAAKQAIECELAWIENERRGG